jgi:uncharacterized protein YndB with AHSA1/START domain
MSVLPPVRKTILAACSPEQAFRMFTEGIAQWWPLRTASVSQKRALACAIDLDAMEIYEIRDDVMKFTWGRVTAVQPGEQIAFAWHPGREEEQAQRLVVTFTAADGGSRIELIHDGWESAGDEAADLRRAYETGWETVFVNGYGPSACARLREPREAEEGREDED